MNGKRLIWLATASIVLMLGSSLSWGADSSPNAQPYDNPDDADANPGYYTATDDAPDSMTTDVNGTVVWAEASPVRPDDWGMVIWTGAGGCTAYFEGRSTGWGCFYDVMGVYNGGNGGGGGGQTYWYSAFDSKDDSNAHIMLDVQGYSSDGYVLYGDQDSGGLLIVVIAGGDGTHSYDITLSSDDSDGNVDFSSDSVTVNDGGGSVSVDLYGLALGDVTITADCPDLDSTNVSTKVVGNLHLCTARAGTGDWTEGGTKIAAGGIDTDIHKADVKITYTPNTTLEITLDGGTGHDTDASLVLNGTTIAPGGDVEVDTDDNGDIIGTLKSSDTLSAVTITVTDPEATDTTVQQSIQFVPDNYDQSDQWVSDPDDLVADDSNTETVKFALDNVGLSGHTIGFYITEVDYLDENGDLQSLYNTADNPSDLSDWAYFEDEEVVTGDDGTAVATLYVQPDTDTTTIVSVTLSAYDLTVWTAP
jgi:hypothetical protein